MLQIPYQLSTSEVGQLLWNVKCIATCRFLINLQTIKVEAPPLDPGAV